MNEVQAIGLMSGTSLDGIDVAMIETDGQRITSFGPTGYRPYADGEREVLRAALATAARATTRSERPRDLAEAETLITAAHAEAVEQFIQTNAIARDRIAVVGFHGQTVLHRPGARLTIQLGDGAGLARRLRLPLVFDFRAADVAAGGQGAPFVPAYHQALARRLGRVLPIAVLNIGGVANVTFVGGDDTLIAFDTGPGNALLDDFLQLRTGQRFDTNGETAGRGRVDPAAVSRVLTHPYFSAPCPKSLDRDDFSDWVAAEAGLAGMSVEDGAATLTAITAASIARAVEVLPGAPNEWIVAGGGASNSTLLRMLQKHVAPAPVITANAVGWSGDALEAQAFAFLAVRSLYGLPLSFPGTTGVPRPMPGGVLVQP